MVYTGLRIPRLYAAASLKREVRSCRSRSPRRGIPRLYAAASLKLPISDHVRPAVLGYSAALCRGLIEAARMVSGALYWRRRGYSAALCRGLIEAYLSGYARGGIDGIPRLYAAASLKRLAPDRMGYGAWRIPRLYAAASLKHRRGASRARQDVGIPRLYAAASLKRSERRQAARIRLGIPRLYAAASLKRAEVRRGYELVRQYSAALCRGLIEATSEAIDGPSIIVYSAALCRGLIEASTMAR